MIFQDPYQTLNPRQRVRHDRRRAAARAGRRQGRARWPRPPRARGRRAGARALPAPLPAPALGRSAPARRDRRRARARARRADLRRARLDARRLGARPDPRGPARSCRGSGSWRCLFITHDLSLAWSLCDRIAVMYLGRIVEQGSAVDVIERPQHPYTQALVTAIPVPDAGRRRAARAAQRASCPTRPTCRRGVASTRAARSASSPATRSTRRCSTTGRRRAARRLPAARPDPGHQATAQWLTERWRDIVGPVGRIEPGPRNAITDVPGVLVGHAQAESGQRTGVTVVAPPSLPVLAGVAMVNGIGELTSKLEIDETGSDADAGLPLRNARGRHRLPGRGARVGQGPGRRRAARWSASATTATWPIRAP